MAKITPSALITAIQGKWNGSCFQMWKNKIIVRRNPIPRISNTASRARYKGLVSSISSCHYKLSPEQKIGWDTYSKLLPSQMSGFDAFMARNSVLILAQHPDLQIYFDAPCTYSPPIGAAPIGLCYYPNVNHYCLFWNNPNCAGVYVQGKYSVQSGYSNQKNPSWRTFNTVASSALKMDFDASKFPAGTVIRFTARSINTYGEVSLLAQSKPPPDLPPALYLLSPNGGETLHQGSTYSILWNSISISNIKIDYATLNGFNWTIRASAADNSWYSVCWAPELSLFVAVSYSGVNNRVMTSPDGIIWTKRAPAAYNQWLSVCWSPKLSLFVAVSNTGVNNRVMTSPDGVGWIIRTSAANNDWRSVCWSPKLSLFVAVAGSGDGNRVMSSPDGSLWTIRDSAADNDWLSVCWSPELSLFVAVAISGSGSRVMTSHDGSLWTIRDSAADNSWLSVCWSPELSLFVAVAISGSGNRVMTSHDGILWTIRDSAADNKWDSVCWSPELSLFVAVAHSGEGNRVMTSPDGVGWIIRTSAANNDWRSVCWSPELSLFVAVATTGEDNRVMTSLYPDSWIEITPETNGPAGRFSWTIPSVDSSHCMVRISDEQDPSNSDTSNAVFTIIP